MYARELLSLILRIRCVWMRTLLCLLPKNYHYYDGLLLRNMHNGRMGRSRGSKNDFHGRLHVTK